MLPKVPSIHQIFYIKCVCVSTTELKKLLPTATTASVEAAWSRKAAAATTTSVEAATATVDTAAAAAAASVGAAPAT